MDFQAVIAGELALLDPTVRGDVEASQALLHDDFREFGASGAVWDRQSIVRVMSTDTTEHSVAEDLKPVRLGPDTVMLTYTAGRGRPCGRRCGYASTVVGGYCTIRELACQAGDRRRHAASWPGLHEG